MSDSVTPGPFMPYAPACPAKTCSSWMVSSQECDKHTNPVGPCCVPTFSTVLNQCCLCPHPLPLPLEPPRCKIPCVRQSLDNSKVQLIGSEEVVVIQLPYIKAKPTLIYPYFYECPYPCSCCSPYECNHFCKICDERIDALENTPPACCMEVNCAPGFKVKPLPFKLPFGCFNLPRNLEFADCAKRTEIINSILSGNAEEIAQVGDMSVFDSVVTLPPKVMPEFKKASFKENKEKSSIRSSIRDARKSSIKSSNKSANNRGRSDESLTIVSYKHTPKSLLAPINNKNRPCSSFEFYENDICDEKKNSKNSSKNNSNNNSNSINKSNNSIGDYKEMPVCVANAVSYDPRSFLYNGIKRKNSTQSNKQINSFKAAFNAGSAILQQQWQRHKDQKLLIGDQTKQQQEDGKNNIQNKNKIFNNAKPDCSQKLEQVLSENSGYWNFASRETEQMEKCCVQQETPQPCILQRENFQNKSFTEAPFFDTKKTQLQCNTELESLPPQADEVKRKLSEKTFDACPLQPYKNWQEEQKKLCENFEKNEVEQQNTKPRQSPEIFQLTQKQQQKSISKGYTTMEEHYAQLRRKQIDFMEKNSRPNNFDVSKEKEMCLVHSSFSSNVDLRDLTNAQRKSFFHKHPLPPVKSCQLLNFENHANDKSWCSQTDQKNMSHNNRYNYTQTDHHDDSHEAKYNGCNIPVPKKPKFNQIQPSNVNINNTPSCPKVEEDEGPKYFCCPPNPTIPQGYPSEQYKNLPQKYMTEANEDMCCCCNTYSPVVSNMVVRQRVLRFIQKERKFCNSRKLSNHLGCFDRPIRNTVAFECELELDDDDPTK